MNKFAERLKELREDKNLSQKQLAKELHVTQVCINRWERNLRDPSSYYIKIICNYFECSADYLIGLKDY